ncbi:MAG: XdhC family protein [Saprospiraceae bacterium]|nr:XdhC family protein [Saprospiraceae bacterium]
MKEITTIVDTYRQMESDGENAALLTVVHVEGSSYRRIGARMLVSETGRWVGGISGGCLEGDALRKAKHAILQARPHVVTYDTREEEDRPIGIGLGCNGRIDVLISPLQADKAHHLVNLLAAACCSRQAHVLVTVTGVAGAMDGITPGDTWLFDHTGLPDQSLPPALTAVLSAAVTEVAQSGNSAYRTFEGLEALVEVLLPPIQVVMCGGNYDIAPFVDLNRLLGWRPVVVANLQKVNPEYIAYAETLHQQGQPLPAYDPRTAIVLMAHDYATDLANLRSALETQAPYIALLGPRKRADKMLAALAAEGIDTKPQAHRLHYPAGLDIGATTPETIALSIAAEITAHFSGRQGGFLRDRPGSIYSS